MLRRKIYGELLKWKKTKSHECLLVNGARQVGKTYIVEQFGKNEYEHYFYLNFIENPSYRAIFEGSLEPAEIYKRLSLYVPDARFLPGSTLIFLDEIQACRKARTALKFLALDDRFDVIASGSLLGVHYKGSFEHEADSELSIPVGYEREITLHALDFEEFLWALGTTERAIGIMQESFASREKIDDAALARFQTILRDYLVVGGMPAVVNEYLSTSNFQNVYAEQGKILAAYEADVEKYAANSDRQKIKRVYYSLARQLSREYTKFQYKTVERNGSGRKYAGALNWLIDAGLVQAVTNVALPALPLAAYEKPEEFKVYASDIGLATHLFGFETQAALQRNTLKGPAKGGIYENLVFDMLSKRGCTLHYYKRVDSTREIEFLLERDGGVVPVEVKSSRGSTPSLNAYIEDFTPRVAYKLIDGNLGAVGCKVTLPQFMAMFL